MNVNTKTRRIQKSLVLIARIADRVPHGHLLASTDMNAFLAAVADEIDRLERENWRLEFEAAGFKEEK